MSRLQLEALNALVTEGLRTQEVLPLPVTAFPRTDIEEACRFLASGTHIGKVLIDTRANPQEAHAPNALGTARSTGSHIQPGLLPDLTLEPAVQFRCVFLADIPPWPGALAACCSSAWTQLSLQSVHCGQFRHTCTSCATCQAGSTSTASAIPTSMSGPKVVATACCYLSACCGALVWAVQTFALAQQPVADMRAVLPCSSVVSLR